MAVALALGSAFFFALASVLQQRAAAEAPEQKALRIGLMLHLLRRPLWLVGYACDWGGFGLQAAALGFGSLLVVQPLLVTGLLFALPLGAWWAGRRLGRGDWVAAIALTVGLAVFLSEGSPTGGRDFAPLGSWIVAGACVGGLMAACVLVALRARGATRALLLALAAASCYGITAGLTKSSVRLLGDGLGTFLTSWEPYVLAAAASVGMIINQSAFQAGALEASLPTLTIVEPIVAAVIGVTLFAERIQAHGAVAWTLVVCSVVLMAYSVLALARSAARLEEAAETHEAAQP